MLTSILLSQKTRKTIHRRDAEGAERKKHRIEHSAWRMELRNKKIVFAEPCLRLLPCCFCAMPSALCAVLFIFSLILDGLPSSRSSGPQKKLYLFSVFTFSEGSRRFDRSTFRLVPKRCFVPGLSGPAYFRPAPARHDLMPQRRLLCIPQLHRNGGVHCKSSLSLNRTPQRLCRIRSA
jgi:hypothetical protein